MATRVKYIGPYHFRVIRPSDFEREGAPHGVEVTWKRDGNHTLELPHAVARMLIARFPDEFAAADQPEGQADQPTPTADPTVAG